LSERATILLGCATGKENSRAIDLLRQFGENDAQTLGRGEPKIRWWQLSLIENAKFGTGCVRYGFDQCPGGFGAAAFNAEDAFTGFHDSLCLTAFGAIERWIAPPRRNDANSVVRGQTSASKAGFNSSQRVEDNAFHLLPNLPVPV
jgi:hypothetical protein